MDKKFYIRQRNIITGPFERQVLINMLNQGRLSMHDSVSTDKLTWYTPQQALGLIIPERVKSGKDEKPSPPDPPSNTRPIIIPDEPAINEAAEDFSQKPNLADLLLNVTASLGNGSGYLSRLNQYSGNVMLTAGVIAVVFSLLFVILGILLFGSCYNVSKAVLCVRCLIVTLLSGAFFWGGNELLRVIASPEKKANAPEASFLAAMHAMMSMSVIGVVLNGTVFIFNRNLFNMSMLQISTVLAAALLPLIFFSANTILSLRINFMGNCKMSPGISSLMAVLFFYTATILSVLLLYAVYRFA